jgi:hypothetical protein
MNMLPNLHRQAYGVLRSRLEVFRDRLLSHGIDLPALATQWQDLQSYFQAEVLGLTAEGLDSAQGDRWQSLQTEIYKTMRLLDTDILFLKASRQTQTTEQRLKIIVDRLGQLIAYCQLLTDN